MLMHATPPIAYAIDKTLGLIVEVWTGDVTAAALRQHWRTLLTDPEALEVRRTLVDLRNANVCFTGAEMSNLVECVVIPLLDGGAWKTAIVTDQPATFGVSRQYQVFAESYSTDCIFHDRDEAIRWLCRTGE